jgi:hypothetical protein
VTGPLPRESYTALEAAFLRILRAREGNVPVHPLRHDADALRERPATPSDDDRVKASA